MTIRKFKRFAHAENRYLILPNSDDSLPLPPDPDFKKLCTELGLDKIIISNVSEFLMTLKNAGFPVAKPLLTDHEYVIDGLYNPDLALSSIKGGIPAKIL